MHIITDRVHPDEPCFGLHEGPLQMSQPDGSTPLRWVQRLFVIRGDAMAKYVTDFGPASDWPNATPFAYPSYGDDTVAQLQELAEHDRHSDKWARRRRERMEGSTLIADILRQEEQKIPALANRSVFGPGVSVQRNEAQRGALIRAHKEAVNNGRTNRHR